MFSRFEKWDFLNYTFSQFLYLVEVLMRNSTWNLFGKELKATLNTHRSMVPLKHEFIDEFSTNFHQTAPADFCTHILVEWICRLGWEV